jgi:shikimate dehydrogenase
MNTEQAKIYGLIGYPVAHSLSPIIFEYLFKKHRIKASYHLFPLRPKQLKSALEGMRILGINGLNVTAPYKRKVISLLDSLDDFAQEIGAVNVICYRKGNLKGYNTDVIGVKRTLQKLMPIRTKIGQVALIGAGGAARACLQALKELDPERILLFNRTAKKAKRLVGQFNSSPPLQYRNFKKLGNFRENDKFDLVINATSGRNPVIKKAILKGLSRGSCVFDLNYNLDYGISHRFNKRFCDGLYMLSCQAAESFRIWFGKRTDAEEIYGFLKKRLH